MKIGIGNDHHGLLEKELIINYFKANNIDYIDYGINDDESVDYVDYALKVCNAINNKEIDKGILICGTGIGMSIVANKIKDIRCARVLTAKDAYLSRLHNDANVIAIPEFINNTESGELVNIVKEFIFTPFSTEERHIRRINKINNL